MTDRDDLIEGANWYQTKRHYTPKMTPHFLGYGFSGVALCSTDSNPVEVYDQSFHQERYEREYRHKVKPFEKLPLCKKCAKKVEKLTSPT